AVIKMTKSGVRNWFGLILFVVIFIARYLDFLPVTIAIIIGAVVAIVYCELMQKKTGLNPALEAKKKNEKA
ncbi:MAG: hypothetical protein K2H85_00660, partial [Allobaculum sp.]|nr:hypothetical protein [Allobaculum sp.]